MLDGSQSKAVGPEVAPVFFDAMGKVAHGWKLLRPRDQKISAEWRLDVGSEMFRILKQSMMLLLWYWWFDGLSPKKCFWKNLCVCELYLRVPTHKKVSTYTYLNIYIFFLKGPQVAEVVVGHTKALWKKRSPNDISANKGAVFGAYSFQGQYSLAQWPTFLLAFLEV